MTSPLCVDSDESVHAALSNFIGARIDAAHFVPESALVLFTLYDGRKHILGVGIGPACVGVGLLSRLPLGRAGNQHPLVAAMRAHLVGATLRDIDVDAQMLWIIAESAQHHAADGQVFPVRLALEISPRGCAQLLIPSGSTITWPPGARPASGSPSQFPNAPQALSLATAGAELLEKSDSFRVHALRQELLTVVRTKRRRLERRADAVRHDLSRLADVPRLQKMGSLLLAQGQTITKGTTRATLLDWETNENIEINLAPDKPIQEQANEFFQKARRWQRGAHIMRTRLEETDRILHSLDALETAILAAPADWDALQKEAQHLHVMGLLAKPVASISLGKSSGPDERKPYHTFRSTNGQTIWVGRSGKDNDELVTRFAKPHDLWLHAKNIRGAHVVVPLEKNRACPPQVLVDAATLAIHFSEARNEAIAEVSYVERRYVRKPKKSPAGSVTTQREKVIAVRIEKDRVTRLLGSKVET